MRQRSTSDSTFEGSGRAQSLKLLYHITSEKRKLVHLLFHVRTHNQSNKRFHALEWTHTALMWPHESWWNQRQRWKPLAARRPLKLSENLEHKAAGIIQMRHQMSQATTNNTTSTSHPAHKIQTLKIPNAASKITPYSNDAVVKTVAWHKARTLHAR